MPFDSEIFNIAVLSLQVSAIATMVSLLIGLPLGQVGTAKQVKSTPVDETVAAFLHELPQ